MSKKKKFVKPDEVFAHGPMSMARFGKNTVFQSNWSPDEFAKMQKQLVEQYPKVVQEIDGLATEIAQLVSELPPDQLLHRAWWEMVGKNNKIESEPDVGMDEIISVRMVDYIQSVIASVEPAVNQRKEITDQEWENLTGKVEQLFQTVTSIYQICLSAKNEADAPNHDKHFEEFKFKAQLYWCNIRGKRHQVHEHAYLKDMFLPHSDVLKELFGINCAYPMCEVSGGKGAKITWGWAESLYLPKSQAKGQRDEFIGKTFHGMTDTFLPGGEAHQKFSSLWWRAGRWCLISIKTGAEPLTIERLALNESRYPVENEGAFDGGDPELAGVIKLATRGIQMCSHETFMDCPYYEQLQYDGDTRLELLTTYTMTRDDRLPKRAIELFDYSRRNWGFVNERYPVFLPQQSPTFSLIWATMLSDYVYWRNDVAFVKARAIGLRSMLEHFEPYVNRDGLLENLPGWPFMDWVPQWHNGNAPDGTTGVSGLNNLLYVYALQKSALVEDYLAEPLLAQRLRAKAERAAAALRTKFWDDARGLMADNLAHTEFSEHGQCLALLSDTLTGDQAKRCFGQLISAPDLKRTTIYFNFYLLETFQKFGRGDLIVDRMSFWKDLVKLGLKTPVESPGDTRSDCHAWGSHPLFNLHASVAGIRPDSPGFRTVRIAPQPGRLPKIVSRLPHPDGFIALDLKFANDHCSGTVELPAQLTGVFVWRGKEAKLNGGSNRIELSP